MTLLKAAGSLYSSRARSTLLGGYTAAKRRVKMLSLMRWKFSIENSWRNKPTGFRNFVFDTRITLLTSSSLLYISRIVLLSSAAVLAGESDINFSAFYSFIAPALRFRSVLARIHEPVSGSTCLGVE